MGTYEIVVGEVVSQHVQMVLQLIAETFGHPRETGHPYTHAQVMVLTYEVLTVSVSGIPPQLSV